ncbi:MAG TPA: Hpt domain-containing protein, partial [bacterium]|nr:Hpt domain-containing protein [bacterium]
MSEKVNPGKDDLREQLSQISYLAVKAEPADFAAVLKLAEFLKLWAEEAKKIYGAWTSAFLLQANQVIKGLKAGRPTSQGLERIIRSILEADKTLAREAEKADLPIPGREVLVFHPGTTGPADLSTGNSMDFLALKEEDIPGLKDFLLEAPFHFTAIEEVLLQADNGENWDLLKVYRPFHTLKSLFGYLGFQSLSALSHQAENLLEPFKKSGGKPTNREVGILLKILDLFRLQTGHIREGLGRGRIEICPVPSLFEKDAPANVSASDEKIPPSAIPAKDPEGEEKIIRIDTSKMDGLMETLEEWITYQTRI